MLLATLGLVLATFSELPQLSFWHGQPWLLWLMEVMMWAAVVEYTALAIAFLIVRAARKSKSDK